MNYSFIISFFLTAILALLAIAFYTLMERKFLGYWQLRKGPNKVIFIGLPQPFADAIKLFVKERSIPVSANSNLFYVAPILGLFLTLLLWVIYPHASPAIFIIFGALYFMCVSRINVYVTFISGWCANSKYALMGALRRVAQTISYEVSMALLLIRALLIIISMDIHTIPQSVYVAPIFLFIPVFIIWFITNLAETNRSPFDLAEGESELVSGFNIEYRRGLFALIFIAEYANILIMSLLTSVFFGGATLILPNTFLLIKTMLIATLFLWVRATLPRIRYDNLIYLTWKSFLPISLSIIILTLLILIFI